MSFLNSIWDWINNTIIKTTYDPAADALKQVYRQNVSQNLGVLQSTVGGLGSGLGNAVLSIPGISDATHGALSALQHESESILAQAKSMTPDQIAIANDNIQKKYNDIKAQADADGISYNEELKKQGEKVPEEFSLNSFFKDIFNNTLYICLFFLVLFLCFLGSSLAANAAIHKPFAYRIYYMVYGFILFPIPLLQGISNVLMKKKLFYAVWAPLMKGFSSNPIYNLFLFPFVYSSDQTVEPSHYTSSSLIANPQSRFSLKGAFARREPITIQEPMLSAMV